MHAVDSGGCSLVVSLLFEPAARVAAQVEAPDLVVDEDRQHERDGGQPPHEPEPNDTLLRTSVSSGVYAINAASAFANNRHIDGNKKEGNTGDTHFRGYIRSPLSIPGVYERKAASAVSKMMPKLRAQLRIPWCTIELRRVLQIIKSAHCTTTMDTKNAVWQVYSRALRSR